jgi:FtsP/CotA-like multicopper oxidase with cupredoxin domain
VSRWIAASRAWRECHPLSRRAQFTALLLLALWGTAAAEPPQFDPRSIATSPCGVGVPPPGHASPEIHPGREGLTLTVRQDGSRLCYVANGSADAPVIRVRQGAELTVTLRNEITDPSAIDDVSGPAKLTSANQSVPETPGYYPVIPGMRHPATGATNLHLHGFAVPPVKPQDDVLTVCTDPASAPAGCGQRQFTYHYRIPADMPEGLYWYHPHVHGELQAQMLMGLAGAIIVEGPAADARRARGIAERVLIVRQTQDLDAAKTQAAAMTAAPPESEAAASHERNSRPATAIDTTHELLCVATAGVDVISLNGTPVQVGDAPDAALAHFVIPATRVELWRVLNAATDAFLDLALVDADGRPLPMTVVARDGSPLTDDAGAPLPARATLESQFVPPSGRIEVLVRPPPAGHHAYLVTHAVDTGCAGDRVPERRLALIEASAPVAAPAAPDPAAAHLSGASLYNGLLARRTDRSRVIAFAEYPSPGQDDQTDFYIVERKPGAVLKPYHMGTAPAITVKAGTTEEWTIENWTNELHAFHIHQVHFRVLAIDGRPLKAPPLLDVVSVPYATATGYHSPEGPVRPGRVRIKLSFPATLAGDIPFHCHLADHEDNGMMAVLRVLPAQAPNR